MSRLFTENKKKKHGGNETFLDYNLNIKKNLFVLTRGPYFYDYLIFFFVLVHDCVYSKRRANNVLGFVQNAKLFFCTLS